MKEITLHVSGYSSSNADMAEIKGRADLAFNEAQGADGTTNEGQEQKKLKTREGRKGYDSLRKFWVADLDNLFANIPCKKEHNSIVGMFKDELEPSSQFTFRFESEEDWCNHEIAVKERLIQFGTRFHQSNVHLVDLYASKPGKVQYGELVGDVTFQKKLWVLFNVKEMKTHLTFDNFRTLKEIAEGAGVHHLTCDIYGRFAMMIYSMGPDGHVIFDEISNRVIVELANRNLICKLNRCEDVALVNYGNPIWGATHTYEAARGNLTTLTPKT